MTPRTRKWIVKAEEDYRGAVRLLRARKEPTYNLVCYHAQQCAEKCLKALLVEKNIVPERTHDLVALLSQVAEFDGAWELLRNYVKALTDYAVRFRYPDNDANKVMARDALKACALVRERAHAILGLPSIKKKPKRAGAKGRKRTAQRKGKHR